MEFLQVPTIDNDEPPFDQLSKLVLAPPLALVKLDAEFTRGNQEYTLIDHRLLNAKLALALADYVKEHRDHLFEIENRGGGTYEIKFEDLAVDIDFRQPIVKDFERIYPDKLIYTNPLIPVLLGQMLTEYPAFNESNDYDITGTIEYKYKPKRQPKPSENPVFSGFLPQKLAQRIINNIESRLQIKSRDQLFHERTSRVISTSNLPIEITALPRLSTLF